MEAHTILCISHTKRMIFNDRQNTAFAAVHEANGLYTRHIEWEGEAIKGTACQPQSMYLKLGMELVSCPEACPKRGVVQGVVYTVIDVGPEVKIKINPEYQVTSNLPSDWSEDHTEFDMTLPVNEVPRLLRLTHTMC